MGQLLGAGCRMADLSYTERVVTRNVPIPEAGERAWRGDLRWRGGIGIELIYTVWNKIFIKS
jgi:hypothetical protein